MPIIIHSPHVCLTQPSIGIVTPSFNQSRFIETTINSVLNQTYPNLQYAIVDGGSSDGSIEIIQKYSNSLHYWISEPDKGQSEAINKGLRFINADIIGWLNSDDIILPGALNRVASTFASQPETQVVLGRTIWTDSELNIIRPCIHPQVHKYFGKHGIYYFSQQSLFWRRTLFERVGYLDESLHTCMDIDLWIKILKLGIKITVIPYYLSVWRLHKDCKSCATGWGKGTQWDADRTILRSRHKDMQYGCKSVIALLLYYLLKIFTGPALSTLLFQLRWKNKPLSSFIKRSY